jgi:hypothetical protein
VVLVGGYGQGARVVGGAGGGAVAGSDPVDYDRAEEDWMVKAGELGTFYREEEGKEEDELSQLQHIRQTQPGSPLRPTRTDRLLSESVMVEANFSDGMSYTMLLVKVHTQPINVRTAMVLSFRLPGALSKCLYE